MTLDGDNVRTIRLITGFVVAPIVPGMVLAALPPYHGDFGILEGVFCGGLVLAPYTYVATAIFGIPAFLVYHQLNLARFTQYVAGGFFGPIAAFLLFGVLVHDATLPQWLRTGAWFGLLTAPATAVFWVIVVWNPRSTAHGGISHAAV
jgi:hypothetical protein